MTPDHKAAKKWAHDVWGTLKDIALHEVLETDAIDHRNVAACYLDAMTRLDKAEKMRDVAYGLLDECKAQLDKATELLEEVDAYWGATRPALAERIRDFLDERK